MDEQEDKLYKDGCPTIDPLQLIVNRIEYLEVLITQYELFHACRYDDIMEKLNRIENICDENIPILIGKKITTIVNKEELLEIFSCLGHCLLYVGRNNILDSCIQKIKEAINNEMDKPKE